MVVVVVVGSTLLQKLRRLLLLLLLVLVLVLVLQLLLPALLTDLDHEVHHPPILKQVPWLRQPFDHDVIVAEVEML